MRSILLIFLLASIIPMKSFKQFLIEQKQEVKCDINGICKVIRKYESAGNEEKILGVYKDNKGLPTIGHGHLITKESPAIFADVFAEEEKQDPGMSQRILAGQQKMTPEQVERLFKRDVEVRLPQVKKIAPEFETYSPELQAELSSEYFRGMVTQSPKAMASLRAGDFSTAADQFLQAKEYETSVKQKSGIAKRMKNLADAMRREGELRAGKVQTEPTPKPEPITPTKPKPTSNEYEVKPGDTLWKIGKGASGVEKIKQLNPDIDPDKIKPGQKIKLP